MTYVPRSPESRVLAERSKLCLSLGPNSSRPSQKGVCRTLLNHLFLLPTQYSVEQARNIVVGETFPTKWSDFNYYTQDYDDGSIPMRDRMTAYVESLQKRVIAALDGLDPVYKFHLD